MFTPISRHSAVIAAVTLLAACGGKDDNEALLDAEQQANSDAYAEGKIECALAGSAAFERQCTAERISGEDGQILVLRHKDGGFRRFRILTDGRGLEPADGFDETRIAVLGNGMIEVSSGDDKYRLPAQIKPGAAAEAEKGS